MNRIGIINMEKEKKQYRVRFTVLICADILCIVLSYLLALWVRFDMRFAAIPMEYLQSTMKLLPLFIGTSLFVYVLFHLYGSIWRYASITEAYHIVLAYLVLAVALLVETMIFRQMGVMIPKGVSLIAYAFSAICCVAIRFGYRLARFLVHHQQESEETEGKVNVLVVGAGQAGKEIISDLRFGHNHEYSVKALVDDNPIKKGRFLEGVRVMGNRYEIPALAKKYNIRLIIIAMPSATTEQRIAILNICKETGCRLKIIPGIYQMVTGEISFSRLRDVQVEDLLGRQEVHFNLSEIKAAVEGKVIMVTGGGGSIGSELCRQIASAHPKQLIIFDIYENNAYELQQELLRKYGDRLNLVTLIGSVRNTSRVESVIEKYKPDVIYHAAAHKHVPLMEVSPCEAVKNNVMGTYKLAKAAARNHVSSFLLISTDKAVNPTSLMGATKRICEMIIQMMSRKCPETTFMAVRFGNVLGSNGSVIPLFKEQIAKGGPVTVTDKNIVRYFMTIPEAVSLVLEASHYAKGGEIFILDMGEPVRIDDMARNLIKLSGLKPDEDIQIVYTGLRPGEKLYEELLMAEEGLKDTPNTLIHIGHPIEMDDEQFEKDLALLDEISRAEAPPDEMKRAVARVVPTYKPDLCGD